MGNGLVPKSSTLGDYELNCYKFKLSRNIARLRMFGRQQRLNDRPMLSAQKCCQVILVSSAIKHLGIFACVPLGGDVK